MPVAASPDWRDIGYLEEGSPEQRDVYAILRRSGLLKTLRDYDPVLAGTVPLNLQVAGSDLDIICEAYDFDAFERLVRERFGELDGFVSRRRIVGGVPRLKANFMLEAWPVELFAQPLPVFAQNAVVHMTVEHRLLAQLGPALRDAVLRLKERGVKTEPAFAELLGLDGDPYEAMLALAARTDEELLRQDAVWRERCERRR